MFDRKMAPVNVMVRFLKLKHQYIILLYLVDVQLVFTTFYHFHVFSPVDPETKRFQHLQAVL